MKTSSTKLFLLIAGVLLVGSFNVLAQVKVTNFSTGAMTYVLAGTDVFYFTQLNDLYKSDGTSEGTLLLKDFGNVPYLLATDGNTLYFSVDDGTHGHEMWVSDGTIAGTQLTKDIRTGTAGGAPSIGITTDYVVSGGVFYFRGNDGNGNALWKTDGTESGTIMVKDVNPKSSTMTDVNGTLFFIADDASTATNAPWKSDGTSAGTVVIKEVSNYSSGSGAIGGSNYTAPVNINGTVYFQANNADFTGSLDLMDGRELWKSDLTSSGTVLVEDIITGSTGSAPSFFTNVDGTLFFTIATTSTIASQLWKSTDGTAANTSFVANLTKSMYDPRAVGNKLIYSTLKTTLNDVEELWVSDGTGATLLKEIEIVQTSNNNLRDQHAPVVHSNEYFFIAQTTNEGRELWKSDGTVAGTVMVDDLREGTNTSSSTYLTSFGDYVYFRGTDGTGLNIWKYKSGDTEIYDFSFSEETGDATIDYDNHTIDIEVATGTDVSSLVATFLLSNNSTAKISTTDQISGTTANDFTNAVDYIITADDGTTNETWTVTVTVAPVVVPAINSFTPTNADVGATVTITGTGFDDTPANNTVYFGSIEASVTAATTTQLTVVVPSGATYGRIGISVNNLTSYTQDYFTPTFDGGIINSNTFDGTVSVSSTITAPREMAIFDFNQDGKQDIVFTSYGNDRFVVRENTTSTQGSITFAAEEYVTAGDGPIGLAIADFDADGKMDMVSANALGNNIWVRRNLYTPGFAPSFDNLALAATDPHDVTTGDFDGDGKPDIAVMSLFASGSPMLSIFRNMSSGPGNISFDAKVDFTPPNFYVRSIIAADMNSDGLDDIVTSVGGTVHVYKSTSTGPGNIGLAAAAGYQATSNSIAVLAADLNQDGKPDLITANTSTMSVLINTHSGDGNLSMATKEDFTTGNVSNSVTVADFNGDGKPDVAVSSINDEIISVFQNNSTGGNLSLGTRVDFTSPDPTFLSSADLDGDGKPELISGSQNDNSVTIFKNATLPPSTDTELLSFSFTEQTGDATISTANSEVDIEVAYGTDVSNLVATFTLSSGATATVSSTSQTSTVTANDFSNTVTYTVTAEDQTTTEDWTVNVSIAPNTETDFTAFSFTEQTGAAAIDATNHTILIEVALNTGLTNLTPTFTLSAGANASIGTTAQTTATTSNDYSSTLIYTVTAEDGSTSQDWEITVNEESNNETDITAFSFSEETASITPDATAHTIDIEVSYGTDVSALIATFTLSEGANTTVNGITQSSGATDNDFSNDLTYTVTAEDGTTTQDWIITVTIEKNTETDITVFSFQEESATVTPNATDHSIDIEVVYGTDVSALVATFALSGGASITIGSSDQTSGTTSNDYSSVVTYTVLAEDGTTSQDWTINVTVGKNTATDITTFSLADQTSDASISSENHTIDVIVARGTDLTDLTPSFTLSAGASAAVGTTDQTSETTSNDFTNSVTYTVTAEDGTTSQDWVVSVTAEKNSETDFTAFSFPSQTGDATINTSEHTITVEVARGADVTSLIASFLLSDGATASIETNSQSSETTSNDFSSKVTYTVTAEDGNNSQDWEVTVSTPLNSETDFTSFLFAAQTSDPSISTENHTISVEVASGTDLSNLVAEFSLSDGAKASIGSSDQVSGTTANDFSSDVTYTITAEDGTTSQAWIVSVEAPTAEKQDQTITFNDLVDVDIATQTTVTLNATASSELAVSFSLESGPATLSANTLTLTGTGTVEVKASQAGNDEFNEATPITRTFEVTDGSKENQTITFSLIDEVYEDEGPITLEATASSELEVTFEIASGSGTIDGNQLTFDSPGSIVVKAVQEGNESFNPASVSETIQIKALLSISGKITSEGGSSFSDGEVIASLGLTNFTTVIDSDGTYSIEGLRNGDYYVSVSANASSDFYSTFYGDVIFWEETSLITVDQNLVDINIEVQSKPTDSSLTGSGSIEGRIIEQDGARISEVVNGRILDGTAIENVSVFLIAMPSESILTEVKTDVNGDFKIDGIPNGEFRLKVEVAGLSMDLANSTITISDDAPEVVLTAMINEDGISLEIEEVLGSETQMSFQVFPNPFLNEISFDLENLEVGYDIQLISLSGTIIINETVESNMRKISVPPSIPNGLYIFRIIQNNQIRATKTVLKN